MALHRGLLELLPPVGEAVGITPLFRGCKSWISRGADADAELSFFADYLGMRHALGVSSGRAALCVILNGLQSLRPGRSVVALPAYTCFSVAASIARAGLKLYPVEIDSQTLDYDYGQLGKIPSDELLCILTSNLFGFVNDVGKLRAIAREKNAFVVDDVAQSLGASRNGNLSGTIGDVSFFSLGRGKPLSTGGGGIVVTDSDEIAEAVHEQLARLAASSWRDNAVLFAKELMTSVFINRHLYWIPDSLPFLRLGTTPFEPSFPVKKLPLLSLALAQDLLGTLAELNEERRKRAAWIAQAIDGNDSFTIPRPLPGCNPTYLRFPVVAKNRELRCLALKELRRAGIGASSFYPSAICDIPVVEKFMGGKKFHRPKAEDLASRLLTLPTHSQVRKDDAERMGHLLAHLPKIV
jgi:perosamine synthetase